MNPDEASGHPKEKETGNEPQSASGSRPVERSNSKDTNGEPTHRHGDGVIGGRLLRFVLVSTAGIFGCHVLASARRCDKPTKGRSPTRYQRQGRSLKGLATPGDGSLGHSRDVVVVGRFINGGEERVAMDVDRDQACRGHDARE